MSTDAIEEEVTLCTIKPGQKYWNCIICKGNTRGEKSKLE